MEGTEFTVKVTPQGEIITLYREDLPIQIDGRRQMVRASNVLWNEDTQRWEVHLNMDQGPEKQVKLKDFAKRSEAIQWEVEFLEAALVDGFAAENLFKA